MPISGTRYKPTTPNAQRSTPNVSMEAVRFEVLDVERWALKGSLVASSLLAISSLAIPTKPKLLTSLRTGSAALQKIGEALSEAQSRSRMGGTSQKHFGYT